MVVVSNLWSLVLEMEVKNTQLRFLVTAIQEDVQAK